MRKSPKKTKRNSEISHKDQSSSGSNQKRSKSSSESDFKSGKYWKPKRGYFSDAEEALVREYKATKDDDRRKAIFTELYPKLEYLATSIIFKFRIPLYFDDVDFIKQDCMCAMLESLEKFDPYRVSPKTGKPSKFYSYGSVTVSNFLRQIIKKRKNKLRFENDLSMEYVLNNLDTHGATKFSMPKEKDELEKVEEELIVKEFFLMLGQDMKTWHKMLHKENDQKVMDAIVKIFEDFNRLESLGKKEIYFLIKEMTNLKSQQINGSLKNIRRIYVRIKEEYYHEGK